jgi:hypothetical protein
MSIKEGHEIIAYCGDDARKWAEQFCLMAKHIGEPVPDEEWVFGWFANAIEASHDKRTGGGPVVLPDGSAFFVATV